MDLCTSQAITLGRRCGPVRFYQINEILVLYIIVPFFPELPGIQNGFNSSPEYTARGGGGLIVWFIPMSGCKHFDEFSIKLFLSKFLRHFL